MGYFKACCGREGFFALSWWSLLPCLESSCREATSHSVVHGLTPSGYQNLSIGHSIPTTDGF